ncbi:ArsC/Spx/MgsR family protein [Flavobacterium sp. TAB 87]|uniref:ArsC/Spx/MgsR family protein n=1 Tax=Flavobacterium sp. TAB 87 TaxID=1729581 RepID=UPI00076CB6FD|nr:ArsC/Spx/MgsR family protein [Flavobacterium sp. TAB 87]KVV14982.1 Arsenate reductase [Flavobacterium sp. TAB 87]
MIQIYHNPRCGKSRSCVTFLQEENKEFEVIPYLSNVPSAEELQQLLLKLNLSPLELVRTKEKIWIEKYKDQTLNDEQIIQALADNPILIERPIVVKDGIAIIGRDLEKVANFLE